MEVQSVLLLFGVAHSYCRWQFQDALSSTVMSDVLACWGFLYGYLLLAKNEHDSLLRPISIQPPISRGEEAEVRCHMGEVSSCSKHRDYHVHSLRVVASPPPLDCPCIALWNV